jgi:NAD-dependent deacetylase
VRAPWHSLPAGSSVVVLTGAGISAASGLPTFRGPGGLWTTRADPLTARDALERPAEVWALFGDLRARARAAEANPAHLALARLEQRLANRATLLVVTQNIDGLHQRAGSAAVIELHGSLFRTRCASPTCALPPFADEALHDGEVPRCPRCAGPLRPDVVLFEEPLPAREEHTVRGALREAALFVAVGTSGTVEPACSYARAADYAGARTVLVNLEPMDPPNPYFHEVALGRAEEILPRWIS